MTHLLKCTNRELQRIFQSEVQVSVQTSLLLGDSVNLAATTHPWVSLEKTVSIEAEEVQVQDKTITICTPRLP